MGKDKQSAYQESQNKPQKVEPITETLKEYAQGVVGGLLFSLPLLYTMEMWWRGFTAPPSYLIAGVGITYILLLGYNRYAGMRKDSTWWEVARDSVEELGLAVIVSFLILWLLNRINFGMSTNEIMGKVVIESMVVAIGVSVGTAKFGRSGGQENQGKSNENEKNEENKGGVYNVLHYVSLATCGAVLFAATVSPTEEIQKLAVSSDKISILIMVFMSLALSMVILFFSNFIGTSGKKTPVSKMAYELVVSYSVAILVSLGMIWFFGRIESSFSLVVSEVAVLGIPASIGASAGRLLISG